MIIKIPKDGIVKTSSSTGTYSKEGYYISKYDEYYYYLNTHTRKAKQLKMGGGYTVQKEGSNTITHYFWVSSGNTEEDYLKYVKNRDVLQEPICGTWEK